MVGEIHLAKIYFTDATAAKIRPVLLLKLNSFSDVLYFPLTSNISTKGIIVQNDNLQDGFLPKTSVIVYEKPGVISEHLLIKKIGTIRQDFYVQAINKLIEFLQK